MEFFDKKQEVLEVKLTRYGKYKLSQGRFKPTYYSFFDEGVLYDSRNSGEGDLRGLLPSGVQVSEAGFVEKQNEIESRIQDNTAMLKTLNIYSGIQTNQGARSTYLREQFSYKLAGTFSGPYWGAQAAAATAIIVSGLGDPLYGDPGAIYAAEELQPVADRAEFLSRPLGKSKISADKQPSWKVNCYAQEIEASSLTWTRNRTQPDDVTVYQEIDLIPQIDISCKYNTYIKSIGEGWSTYVDGTAWYENPAVAKDSIFTTPTETNTLQAITTALLDDIYISVEHKALVVGIGEENVDFNRENFDIEVFLSGAQYGTSDNGYLKALRFRKDPNDFYDPNDVGYYLAINRDEEINSELSRELGIDNIGMVDPETGAVSTRHFFVKDLYRPADDLCPPEES
jgi:hypothetical protein